MDGLDLVVADCEEEFEGKCPKKCTKTIECGKDSALSDFTWGDKYGLKFQRVEGPSNNALVACDRWGYVGGRLNDVNHGSQRISSRKAVFTQASSKNEMQDVEFHFCSAVVVKFAKMWPLRA